MTEIRLDNRTLNIVHHENGEYKIYISKEKNWWKELFGKTEYIECGSFYLIQFPGCSGSVVFFKAFVEEPYRNLKIGTIMVEYVIDECRRLNYSNIMATVNNETPRMHRILQKKEFTNSNEFNNKKTHNLVTVYKKNI